MTQARVRGHQKYNNHKVLADGASFDSRAEYRHWQLLLWQAKAGELSHLRRQVVYELAPAVVLKGRKRPPLRYIADFVFTDKAGREVVQDVKGAVTDAYRIKRHLMMAVHGIEVQEVRA